MHVLKSIEEAARTARSQAYAQAVAATESERERRKYEMAALQWSLATGRRAHVTCARDL